MRWAGVEARPPAALTALVTAADGDPARFVGHLTLLRRLRGAPTNAPAETAVPDGPWWRPAEVLLMASEPGRGGPRYRVRAPRGPRSELGEGSSGVVARG
ncbi:2'-5' RNA ligase family protein [Pseudonocardia sp. ICBG601]|uniref:2'-5' RNA ligase family protein n=1 Tax=Pseudonocardia sp. ICBG601 TaxID=2846759 RepID=UPI001CF6A2CC|nr:hypothetical protein [Pseudonocardia sp. ICBG601]